MKIASIFVSCFLFVYALMAIDCPYVFVNFN